jgi:hypothetical protein
MKKHLLLPFLAFFAITVNGQNSIPNGNFENWTQGTYNIPLNYTNSSNPGTFFRLHTAFNVTKSTDFYHGAYAVQLTTNVSASGDTSFGYFINTNPGNDEPSKWHGGIPYTQIPKGIRGYYKYNIATADSGSILVAFSKAGSNIGTYVFTLGGVHSTYTLFNFTFSPALSTSPDSVIFAAISCKFTAATQKPVASAEGSLILDSISFKGVNSQPAQFNGDFENWQSQNLYKPDNWYYNGDDQGDGMYRSTDPKVGSYALELKTYSGNNNNKIVAQPGQLSNAYYNSSFQCVKGGIPFTEEVDTLAFYYKYAPMNNDSANINLNFTKNGSNIWGAGISLHASASYKSYEFPINIGSVPDSVKIQIQSSSWNDTALTFVGSDLFIDDLHFKSQPVISRIIKMPYNNNLSFYPNPTSGKLEIPDVGFDVQRMEIYDVQGKKVYVSSNFKRQVIYEIDLFHIAKGVYVIKVYGRANIRTEKIVIE